MNTLRKVLVMGAALAGLLAVAPAMAQDGGKKSSPRVRIQRIRINHADPQLIWMILTGKAGFYTAPEISTLVGSGNSGFGSTGLGNSESNGGFGNSNFGSSSNSGGHSSNGHSGHG